MNNNDMIKTIDDMIRQWGIKIKDDMERMLSEKPFDKYDFDTITSFECLEDDVTRLNKIAILHDMLISVPTEELVDLFEKHKFLPFLIEIIHKVHHNHCVIHSK